jgi:hypothetical protein
LVSAALPLVWYGTIDIPLTERVVVIGHDICECGRDIPGFDDLSCLVSLVCELRQRRSMGISMCSGGFFTLLIAKTSSETTHQQETKDDATYEYPFRRIERNIDNAGIRAFLLNRVCPVVGCKHGHRREDIKTVDNE